MATLLICKRNYWIIIYFGKINLKNVFDTVENIINPLTKINKNQIRIVIKKAGLKPARKNVCHLSDKRMRRPE